jgi:hypothetical protein
MRRPPSRALIRVRHLDRRRRPLLTNSTTIEPEVPGVFVAGEMLDYDAPTGGYLLQAAFATGLAAGRGAACYLGLSPDQSVAPPEPGQTGLSPRQSPNGRAPEASNKYSL